jgi:hypothetical protein
MSEGNYKKIYLINPTVFESRAFKIERATYKNQNINCGYRIILKGNL